MTTRRTPRRSVRRGTGRRRETRWEQFVISQTLLSSGAVQAVNLTPEPMSTGGSEHRGGRATLIRAIMNFSIHGVSASASPQIVSVGIYVADHEAVLQTSFLDPNADPLQDWYYWTSRNGQIDSTVNQVTTFWDADIRSKRMLRGGYDLVMVSGGNAALNDTAMDFVVGMRLLWAF